MCSPWRVLMVKSQVLEDGSIISYIHSQLQIPQLNEIPTSIVSLKCFSLSYPLSTPPIVYESSSFLFFGDAASRTGSQRTAAKMSNDLHVIPLLPVTASGLLLLLRVAGSSVDILCLGYVVGALKKPNGHRPNCFRFLAASSFRSCDHPAISHSFTTLLGPVSDLVQVGCWPFYVS